jgi:hypothetical protein
MPPAPSPITVHLVAAIANLTAPKPKLRPEEELVLHLARMANDLQGHVDLGTYIPTFFREQHKQQLDPTSDAAQTIKALILRDMHAIPKTSFVAILYLYKSLTLDQASVNELKAAFHAAQR